MSSVDCSESGCKGIIQTVSYVGPTCSSNAARATVLFENLKMHINEEINYVTTSKDKLTADNSSSVNNKFKAAK